MSKSLAQAGPFARERVLYPLTARSVHVRQASRPAPHFIRLTVAGADLEGMKAPGPGDHLRVFFPDPASGILNAPSTGPDGLIPPPAPGLHRDFTPLHLRTGADGVPELDLDFFLHHHPGPAAQFATRAESGDRLVLVGPRGSITAPPGAERLVCFVDETALPATARWLQLTPPSTAVEVYTRADRWVETYLADNGGRRARVHPLVTDLVSAARAAHLGRSTYVFAAGEASELATLRRFILKELGLAGEQCDFSGYWKRGVSEYDHHAPLD